MMKYKTEIYRYKSIIDTKKHESLLEAKEYLVNEGYVADWANGNCSIAVYKDGSRLNFSEYSDIFGDE